MIRKNDFNLAILTISDKGAKGERDDTSGDVVKEMMTREGFSLLKREIIPDDKELISEKIREACDSGEVDVLLTTGGTGLGSRDVTPEATTIVLDIHIPGIPEAMRVGTLKHTPLAMLSRSVAGIRSGCLVVNLPGSPTGVRECLGVVIPTVSHALEMIKDWRGHPAH